MNIPINRNIDEYQDDFYKGLSSRQVGYAVVLILTGGGAFGVSYFVLGLPQMFCIYITILFALPIAVTGFLKISGMSIPEFLKKRKLVIENPLFLYDSEESVYITDEAALEPRKKKKKNSKRSVYVDLLIQEDEEKTGGCNNGLRTERNEQM